mmetsp:Transcript_421/g.763  ORF Transcript_421/g.763 Transcript_421/m.763 type:complete len:80 (+) Transcript_421:134-373(+)
MSYIQALCRMINVSCDPPSSQEHQHCHFNALSPRVLLPHRLFRACLHERRVWCEGGHELRFPLLTLLLGDRVMTCQIGM